MLASEFISISEASRRVNISRPTLYAWIAQKRLTRYRVGGAVRLLVAELMKESQKSQDRNRGLAANGSPQVPPPA